jgi:hypothetical protein
VTVFTGHAVHVVAYYLWTVPAIITGELSKEFATCTVCPDALPSFTDLQKESLFNTITCEAPVALLQEYLTFCFSLAGLFASYVSIALLTCR